MPDLDPGLLIELNRRLAQCVGWTDIVDVSQTYDGVERPYYAGYPPSSSKVTRTPIPDYCHDLNACAELEGWTQRVSDEFSAYRQPNDIYEIALLDLCNPDEPLWDNGRYLGGLVHAGRALRATAIYKVLAFLVAAGEDTPPELNRLLPPSWINLA